MTSHETASGETVAGEPVNDPMAVKLEPGPEAEAGAMVMDCSR
jgi:hypothetical protein